MNIINCYPMTPTCMHIGNACMRISLNFKLHHKVHWDVHAHGNLSSGILVSVDRESSSVDLNVGSEMKQGAPQGASKEASSPKGPATRRVYNLCLALYEQVEGGCKCLRN